jgi:hypothetical protein
MRIVKHHIARGRLRQPKRARRFVYPVYMVYPEARDEEAYEPIIEGLRRASIKFSCPFSGRGAHVEALKDAHTFGHNLDIGDEGTRGPLCAAAEHIAHRLTRSLEDGFDRAIESIPDPA